MSRLTQTDDIGNWSLEGLPWKDTYVGQVITKNTSEKIYAALCKLKDYEDTGLTPEQAQELVEMNVPKKLNRIYGVFGEFNVIDTETLEVVDRVIGWHTEVIKTDALSECEPFCLPMPLTDYYIKKGEVEVLGNIFDNADLLEVE